MTDDLFKAYVSKMQNVKVSDPLLASALKRADEERRASSTRPSSTRIGTRRDRKFHPQLHRAVAPVWKIAIAACFILFAVAIVPLFSLPKIGSVLAPSSTIDSPFAVKAYGSVDDGLLPSNSNGMLFFNCENETQRMVPLEADQYANEGFYSGCVFSIKRQDKDIVRIQANVSKGELYRVTGNVYSRESDLAFAQEANEWKWYKIGQGDLLAKYDYVAGVPYYGTIHEGEENLGKDRNDPTRTNKVNLYQRLGSTIDTDVMDAPESDMESYSFGLWTNELFDMAAYDPGSTDNPSPDVNINRALDTLDGTQLTITVTFDDGTCATQVIDLHAADFKANIVTTADGINHVLELVPSIVEMPERTFDQALEDRDNGVASIHTLYGLVSETNDDPFPYGDASYPFLAAPLTKPRELEPAPTADDDDSASSSPPGPVIRRENLVAFGTSLEDGDTTTSYESAKVLDSLPDGSDISDLVPYYHGGGGEYNSDTDRIESQRGYSIAADGTPSPGFSYVLVKETVTNTSGNDNDTYLAFGALATLEASDEGYRATCGEAAYAPIWRSDHEGAALDSKIFFQAMASGETHTFSLLYIIPDEMLSSPNLALVHQEMGSSEAHAILLGALA